MLNSVPSKIVLRGENLTGGEREYLTGCNGKLWRYEHENLTGGEQAFRNKISLDIIIAIPYAVILYCRMVEILVGAHNG